MSTVRVALPLNQIKKALHQLPSQEKIKLWRLLDDDLDRCYCSRFAPIIH